jgi:DNA replicative helicase MCM subunit Mcm2 (Cdc46/Mcm family)
MVLKSDLPHITARKTTSGHSIEPVRPMLYCDQCGEQYSADPGDYFYAPPDYLFVCAEAECDKNELRLVSRRVTFEDWKAA